MDASASRSGVGDSDFRRKLFGSDSSAFSAPKNTRTKYSKLEYEEEEADAFIAETVRRQQLVMAQQDETLEKIGASVGVLKDMSEKIGTEVGEHLVIMDDMRSKMDSTETQMTRVMNKLKKVSRLSDDRSQWIAIGVLLLILLIIFVLFAVL